jgi:hypothetical protein
MSCISLFLLFCVTISNASVYSEGDIGDAKCSVESVEFAITGAFKEILSGILPCDYCFGCDGFNFVSFYSNLSELLNCTYLRLFRVNMNKECQFWTKPSVCEETCGLTPPLEVQESDPATQTCSLGMRRQLLSSLIFFIFFS